MHVQGIKPTRGGRRYQKARRFVLLAALATSGWCTWKIVALSAQVEALKGMQHGR